MDSWLKTFTAFLVVAGLAFGGYVLNQRLRDSEQAKMTEWKHDADTVTRQLMDNPKDDLLFHRAKNTLERAPTNADTYALKSAISHVEIRKRVAQPEWDARADSVVQKLAELQEQYARGSASRRAELQDEINEAMREAKRVEHAGGKPSGSVGVELAQARMVRAMNP